MQSYEKHMQELAQSEAVHQELMAKIEKEIAESRQLTPEEIRELERHGIQVVPTNRHEAAKLGILGSVEAVKQALVESGRARAMREQPKRNGPELTREDFPSRQAWRHYQRQLAKGRI